MTGGLSATADFDTGIAIAWLAPRNSYASSVMRRTWLSLRRDPEWSAWLAEHTTAEEPDPMIQFDERTKSRIMRRGAALSYFVPITHVQAAQEARTMTSFAADSLPRRLRQVGREAGSVDAARDHRRDAGGGAGPAAVRTVRTPD
jgi:hypothetical protein